MFLILRLSGYLESAKKGMAKYYSVGLKWENGWDGLSRLERVFYFNALFQVSKKSKKSVPIGLIRPIRFPILSTL